MKCFLTAFAAYVAVAFSQVNSAEAAAIYNIDFGSGSVYSGSGVVGQAGDVWNGLDAGALNAGAQAVVDSSGVDNGVTLSIFDEGNGGSGSTTGGNPADLMDDYIRSNNNLGGGTGAILQSFTFAGLQADTEYAVYIYGASAAGTDRGSRYFDTLNGPDLGSITGSVVDIFDAGAAGSAYTSFSMTTDSSGEFTFHKNFMSGTSTQAPVNGMQVVGPDVAVPEPTALSLLGLGATIALLRRRTC